MDQTVARLIAASRDDEAEFVRLLQEEHSVRTLEHLLPTLYADFGGVILERVADLLSNEDPKLYLSLALWNHLNGYDSEAVRFLEKAQSIAPFDQETLRCDLWLSVTAGEEEASHKCRTLLQMYPRDDWAKQLCQLIAKESHPRSLESPRWDNRWEEIINGQRIV